MGDLVYVGVVGSNFGNSEYVVNVQDCWVTPDNDPTNTVRYDVITSGCADAADSDNIEVLENGTSNQGRFSFASFEFLNQADAALYGHCDVAICDPNTEGAATTTFSFPIQVNSSGQRQLNCNNGSCV